MEAWGVRVGRGDAERVRQRLLALGWLHPEALPAKEDGALVFPTIHSESDADSPSAADLGLDARCWVYQAFPSRTRRPTSYVDELPEALRSQAPRAFDQLGGLVLLKVPEAVWEARSEIGQALLAFVPGATGVFHDGGVIGEFRTRDLTCIAGDPSTRTTVRENGVELTIDPAKAYYSPRLAHDRALQAQFVAPGHSVLDLFGGVAPWTCQLGSKPSRIVCNDLNPEAVRLARINVARAKVEAEVLNLDAHDLIRDLQTRGETFDHVAMNLPHGAHLFLDAWDLVEPGGFLHYHAILDASDQETHLEGVLRRCQEGSVVQMRVVRPYAATMNHVRWTLRKRE